MPHMLGNVIIMSASFLTWARPPPGLKKAWPFRHGMYARDGLVLYNDRVVVPQALRRKVTRNLHAAHQGTSTMLLRASKVVFWPGIVADIEQECQSCRSCDEITPSNPQVLLPQSAPPATPFESICTDYFDFQGKHYLVVVDRLSNWIDITATPVGSAAAGQKASSGACGPTLGQMRALPAFIGWRHPVHRSSNKGVLPEVGRGAPCLISLLCAVERPRRGGSEGRQADDDGQH